MSVISGPSSYRHGRQRIIVHERPPRPAAASLPQPPPPRRASVHRAPQEVIDDFWAEFQSKQPGKPTSIIPQRAYADKAALRVAAQSASGGQSTTASYAEAAAQCRAKVEHIVKECRRVNQKYRDPHFDLELDMQFDRHDCLESLSNVSPIVYDRPASTGRGRRRIPSPPPLPPPLYIIPNFSPQSVKRVDDIFDQPEFFIDGPTANDVRQGRDGDCWLMAALCVYGFVFHRDGEWFSEIIDDKLYLTKPDYDESRSERNMLEDRVRVNSEEAYRKIYQSNSGALYFAQCENPNETWLPLLEKAYAKAHGDYAAIEGGFTGEGIEDLTGGVTSELYTTDILDKEYFWKEELMKVNDTFLFGCSTGVWGKGRGDRRGIVEQHAYSVMRAIEMDGVRLVLLKNPWGRHEWRGAWSDGSKEWTADWIEKLNHRFGDDGSFWISYEDLLRKYQAFDRTRLFGDDWATTSIWTTMNVPWTLEYNDTKFAFTLSRAGPVVLVLSQLDDRYFRGLEGQYSFDLNFRLHKVDADSDVSNSHDDDAFDYVVRSQASYRMSRSVSVELELDAGRYLVLVKIDAHRDDNILPAEEVVRENVRSRREKLIRIGLAYDVAHSKGRTVETPAEKKERRAAAARRKMKEKKRLKEHIMEERALDYLAAKIRLKQHRKKAAKAKAKRMAREAGRQATRDGGERFLEDRAGDRHLRQEKIILGQLERLQGQDNKALKTRGPAVTRETARDNQEPGVDKDMTLTGSIVDDATVNLDKISFDSRDKTNKAGVSSAQDASLVSELTERSPVSGADVPASKSSAGEPIQLFADDERRHAGELDQTHIQPNLAPPPLEGWCGENFDDGRDLPFSLQENRNDSHECNIGGHADGQGRDLPFRGRASRPASPAYASSPQGRPASQISSPTRPSQRFQRGATLPPPSQTSLDRGGENRNLRGQHFQPPLHIRGQPGRAGDDESELSSLSSLSDISDSEVELIYKQQGRNGRRHSGGPRGAAQTKGGHRLLRPRSPAPISRGRRGSTDSVCGGYSVGDPWNAVAVVGLRVYYQKVDGDSGRDDGIVKLWVERRHPFTKTDDSDTDQTTESDASSGDDLNGESDTAIIGNICRCVDSIDGAILGEEKILDVDDSLKDATIASTRRGSEIFKGR
ncbi:hypothetical protein SBRCBS47491_010160 [Sporothrix bragantina]|uniref:Calpain catalytic domain-containing protein n=1 Tax=Sporothrix bragantina TaxID=671064 RepID=A0ABP0D088_9PEZI